VSTKASGDEILKLRLRTQRIEGSHESSVVDTVRHLLAIQAQDFAQALWAVGARTPTARRSDVLGALDRGEVVRSLPMRGTLHFVPPEDLRWMLDLTAERSLASAATRFRNLELDAETLTRAEQLVADRLRGGGRLSRAEFVTFLESQGISCAGQRGYHIIYFLTQRQLVCWGPTSGT
jgi:hypothetical protein